MALTWVPGFLPARLRGNKFTGSLGGPHGVYLVRLHDFTLVVIDHKLAGQRLNLGP